MSTRKLPTFRELVNDFKAFRRGERRVAPYGICGRVYAPRKPGAGAPGPSQAHYAGKKPHATLRMKVTRADGTVEHLTVPAEVNPAKQE